jgi:FkbM family methyltransferase
MIGSLNQQNEDSFKLKSKKLIEIFESTEAHNRWAFGRNLYSEALSKEKLISGFIDDYSDVREWMGLPVIRSKEIKSEYFIIIASGGNTLSIIEQLKKFNSQKIDYFSFQKWSKYDLPEIRFNEGFERHFRLNIEKFDSTYMKLCDDQSREIYEKIINFRLTQNLEHLQGFIENQENQYFDFICKVREKIENFVDIGSYQAENSLTFLENYPDYRRIILVEPNFENFNFCVFKTEKFRNFTHIQAVLGSENKTVEFLGEGTTGLVVQSGGTKIEMKTLDSICSELMGTTLIKMDVEGGEEKILFGGVKTLINLRPILAISGYHRIQDFWKIPEIVFSILENYSLYLRHYTETIYETVFYFILNKN